jgi:hypothetical protein
MDTGRYIYCYCALTYLAKSMSSMYDCPQMVFFPFILTVPCIQDKKKKWKRDYLILESRFLVISTTLCLSVVPSNTLPENTVVGVG